MSDDYVHTCVHMVTDNRIGPNFGKPLIHRECSVSLAAARATLVQRDQQMAALREGLSEHSGLRPGEIGDIEFFHTRNRLGN